MLKKIQESHLMYWTLELLALALLFLIVANLRFILDPIGKFFSSIFVPIVISGFLTYLLLPIVNLLEKIKIGRGRKLPHLAAVLIVLLGFLVLLVMSIILVIPNLVNQITKLAASIPSLIDGSQRLIVEANEWHWVQRMGVSIDINQLQKQLADFGGSFLKGATSSVASMIAFLTSITITAVTVPVMTFYMLNDGRSLVPFVQRMFPERRRDNVADVFGRLSKTMSQYISGQAIEMIFVGVFTTIGYFLIGQRYALLLGVIAGLTNLIPYVGPYIGIVPALFVALLQDPWQVLWVIIVVIVVQQIDGNFLYPKIIGASLKIHPLTIIVLLLAAGNIAGIGGMILAIPVYAIFRTLAIYAWQLWHYEEEKLEEQNGTV